MSNKGGITLGNKFSLADSINYADGAVVSKIIHKNAKGNVTLFSFDEGEGLSEHSAPFDAIVEILDGKTEITIGGELQTLEKGEAVILPANIPHALHAVEKFKMMLIMIKG